MWPFNRKITTTYMKEPDKEAEVKENKEHEFWLYWHGYNITMIAGPFSGHYGVGQATDFETHTVSIAFSNRKDEIWFNAEDLQRWDRKEKEKE